MRFSLRPDTVLSSYSQLTPQMLHRHGIDLLLCDLDYTLAPKSVRKPDEQVRQWLDALLRAGIAVVILSNNRHPRRVHEFCEGLGVGYIGHANKPFFNRKRWYRLQRSDRAVFTDVSPSDFRPGHTAILGDKLLTDMLCANLSRCRAVMVEPLGRPQSLGSKLLLGLQKPFKSMARENF